MAYDYSKLKGKIKEVYDTQQRFAAAMGMSQATLTSKMRGKTEWTQGDIVSACSKLGVQYADIPVYFFAVKVKQI